MSRRRARWLGLTTVLGGTVGYACSCIAAGSRIRTPRGSIDVASLALGDFVLSVDPASGEVSVTTVTAIRRARRECVALRVGTRRLVCTPDHPIYAPEAKGYAPASAFIERRHRTVQVAEAEDWQLHDVNEVDLFAGVHDVYDISVASAHHNYVAEGVLVHNKSWDDGPSFTYACTPRDVETEQCPSRSTCCSDDPAAALGRLPSYAEQAEGPLGEPLFARANNEASVTGHCFSGAYDLPTFETASGKCPAPCNPTWSTEEVTAVCGEDMICCQTRELTEADCIVDETTGRWRAMDGRDAEAAARRGDPNWGTGGTHQDPDFSECARQAGAREGEAFFDCARQLSVANQRGFCRSTDYDSGGCSEHDLVDVCEERNHQ